MLRTFGIALALILFYVLEAVNAEEPQERPREFPAEVADALEALERRGRRRRLTRAGVAIVVASACFIAGAFVLLGLDVDGEPWFAWSACLAFLASAVAIGAQFLPLRETTFRVRDRETVLFIAAAIVVVAGGLLLTGGLTATTS